MVSSVESLTDNRRSEAKGFCKITPLIRIKTEDEISLDIPKSNCDTNANMMKDGELLVCSLDPTGNGQVPRMKGYALQGGVYRQAQSMLDKEFNIYCCKGKFSLEDCAPATKVAEELVVEEISKCPRSRYWAYYDHFGVSSPKNQKSWTDLHSSFSNTSIQSPCVKISDLSKVGGYSNRFIGGGPVCGDENMEIRFVKNKDDTYSPYLVYKKQDDWRYWLDKPGAQFRKRTGVRIVGCCSWQLDGYNVAAAKGVTSFHKDEEGHHDAMRVSQHLLSWATSPEAIRVETCDDFR